MTETGVGRDEATDDGADDGGPPDGRGGPGPARAAAVLLAAMMATSGVAHFVVPRTYAQIVPHVFGSPDFWVRASGVAELGCAGLLLSRRTRPLGGWATTAVLVVVFPANVQMALDGGLAGKGFPLGSPVAAWLRLPLQVPLVLGALGVARRARG